MTASVESLSKTVLHPWHEAHAKKMAPFGGFHMPIEYEGTHAEHLATRGSAGLFDVSHMGRFSLSGPDAVPFLQYTLTNNAVALDQPGMAQYTLIPDEAGAAVDDAYLYRVRDHDYLLVVNAANRAKDLQWLQQHATKFPDMQFEDVSEKLAMMALQGPSSEPVLNELLTGQGSEGRLPRFC